MRQRFLLKVSKLLHMRPNQRSVRKLSLAAALIVAAAFTACMNKEIIVNDFSRMIPLKPDTTEREVVGLFIKTNLDASAEIVLNVGCNGVVRVRIAVPPNQTLERRIDWYSRCAEVSFELGTVVPRSMSLEYRFQEM